MVQSSTLALLAGIAYLLGSLVVFKVAHSKSRFSYILVYSELFHIVGLGVGSIALAIGEGAQNEIYHSFINANGPIDNLTFVHIIAYSIGMVVGVLAYRPGLNCVSPIPNLRKSDFVQLKSFWLVVIFGIGVLFVYAYVVGLEVVLTTAGKSRSNQVDELADASEFLFLKNLARVGIFSVVFVPLIVSKINNGKEIFALFFYGILLYVLTGARAALIDTVFFGFIIYLALGSLSIQKIIYLCIFGFFALLLVLFGKGLGDQVFSSYFEGGAASYDGGDATLSAFLEQFVTLIFSIDAGVKNFIENGPFVSKALLLSPLGVMPGWLFSATGMEWLNWQAVAPSDNIVCLNTSAFPSALPCTAPPYYPGVAAYIGPVSMGFVFAFFKFYIIAAIAHSWHRAQGRPGVLWRPLLAYCVFSRFTLLIPNVLGFLSFWGVVFLGVLFLRKILFGLSVRAALFGHP